MVPFAGYGTDFGFLEVFCVLCGKRKKKDSPEAHVHEDKELIQEFCDFVNLIVMPT